MLLQHRDDRFPSVITVFSAPNYIDSYKNKGAVIVISDRDMDLRSYNAVDHPFLLPEGLNAFTWSLPFVGQSPLASSSLPGMPYIIQHFLLPFSLGTAFFPSSLVLNNMFDLTNAWAIPFQSTYNCSPGEVFTQLDLIFKIMRNILFLLRYVITL